MKTFKWAAVSAIAAITTLCGLARSAEAAEACARTGVRAGAAPAPPLVDPAAIDTALKSVIDSQKIIGVSALVFERGKEVYFGAFGLADRENNKPMARDTIVQIFSMTKPVTGVALMQLYERGKFELDAPLANYLPEFAQRAGLRRPGRRRPAEVRGAEAADHRARHPAAHRGLQRRRRARAPSRLSTARSIRATRNNTLPDVIAQAGHRAARLSARHAVEV